MAALLKEQLSVPQVELISGNRGEFTVWVGDTVVAQKDSNGFPDEGDVVQRVREVWRPG